MTAQEKEIVERLLGQLDAALQSVIISEVDKFNAHLKNFKREKIIDQIPLLEQINVLQGLTTGAGRELVDAAHEKIRNLKTELGHPRYS